MKVATTFKTMSTSDSITLTFFRERKNSSKKCSLSEHLNANAPHCAYKLQAPVSSSPNNPSCMYGTLPGTKQSHIPGVTCFFLFLFSFYGHTGGTQVPGLEVESVLQLLATATATQDPSHICDLHCSSRQQWVLNPLSEARNQTCVLMDISPVLNPLSHNGNAWSSLCWCTIYGFDKCVTYVSSVMVSRGVVLLP